jgi:hypothetical protein
MSNYIRAQSPGEIISGSFSIYRRHFLTIAAGYWLLVIPVAVLEAFLSTRQSQLWLIGPLSQLAGLFASVAITVEVSDICLGNRPSVARSYRRAFDKLFGRLCLTYLLQIAIIALGFVLFIVPGFLFLTWYGFALTVVVLERLSGVEALRRSRTLGKGFYLRNFGTMCALFLPLLLPAIIWELMVNLVLGIDSKDVREVVIAVVTQLPAPLLYIGIVLLYYDLRVRKEAYDSASLVEDLRR